MLHTGKLIERNRSFLKAIDLDAFLHYILSMRIIFIADAHLKFPEDRNYRLMLGFLDEVAMQSDMVVIVGDFFEFWLGDAPEAFPHYAPLLEALDRLVARGIKLLFFEGNHDFHLAGFFSRRFNADVYPDDAVLELDGNRFYICHGDRINRADYSYRLLRFIFRNSVTRFIARRLPYSIPAWIAENLGRHSKGKHKTTAVKWDIEGMLKDFAGKRFSEGFDFVVSGHYHRPFIESTPAGTLLALGDWITQFSYAELIDGRLEQKTYKLFI